jgi:site-specific recombinase XerD
MTALRQRMLEDLQIRNYAPTTIRGYILQVAQFAKHFGKSPDQLGAEHIRAYQLFLVKESGLSQSTYIQVVSALRFLHSDWRAPQEDFGVLTRAGCESLWRALPP